jgi:hypothetical protein
VAILDLPDHAFTNASWALRVPQQVNVSEWTGRRQVMRLPGAARWQVSAAHVPLLGEASARPWRAFLAGLRGSENRFRFRATEALQTGIGGALATNAATAMGATSMQMIGAAQGWTLRRGMFVTVVVGAVEQLLCVTQDAVADAARIATISFEPELRVAVPSATPVEHTRPWALVALDDPQASWSVDRGQIYSLSLTATEAY